MNRSLSQAAMSGIGALYRYLPPLAQSEVASLRGLQLRRQRYGPRTEELVAEILQRDMWSPEQWEVWQRDRLAEVLDAARHRVPAYRRHWDRCGGDWSRLEDWPILEKAQLRADPRRYLADDLSTKGLVHDHTSGTTGASLDLWLRRETVQHWYAMSEARWRRWYGVAQGDRWAMIGGQLVVPVNRDRPPLWVWNRPLRQLYMSSYHLSPALIGHYLDALNTYRVRYLLGYPSSLHALAKGALAAGRSDVRLDVVITNAEPLYAHQRQAIAEAFGCPVRQTYGMSEIAVAAGECEHGSMHLWPDAGVSGVEGDGRSGDLIATGLVNLDMPLIRYRVGDRVTLGSEGCDCGRALPVLDQVEGRSDDVLFTPDGRRVGRLDPVFKDDSGIVEAQIVQERLDCIRLRYVPGPTTGAKAESVLAQRLRDRMGDIEIVFEQVEAIPRGANGKFRAVRCQLDPGVRAELEGVVATRPGG